MLFYSVNQLGTTNQQYNTACALLSDCGLAFDRHSTKRCKVLMYAWICNDPFVTKQLACLLSVTSSYLCYIFLSIHFLPIHLLMSPIFSVNEVSCTMTAVHFRYLYHNVNIQAKLLKLVSE